MVAMTEGKYKSRTLNQKRVKIYKIKFHNKKAKTIHCAISFKVMHQLSAQDCPNYGSDVNKTHIFKFEVGLFSERLTHISNSDLGTFV